MKIRYIRDWINGSNVNADNHWTEIQAYNFQSENVALGKSVSHNGSSVAYGTPEWVTDGEFVNSNAYFNPVGASPLYVQIDLGELINVEKITVWHYYPWGRAYHGAKTEVSKDGVNWTTIFDSDVDGEYAEQSDGRTTFLPVEKDTSGVLPWDDMLLAIILNTGFFETSRYTIDEQMYVTAGNWDDAGMSAGNLQYNWGTADRLTELWNHLLLNHEQVVKDCFGAETAKYTQFRDVCLNKTRAEKIAFGESITNWEPPISGHGLIDPWKDILGRLLQTDECQDKYFEMMDKYYLPNALDLFKQFNVTSRASLSSLFDLSINRGRFYPCNTVQVDFDIIDANETLTPEEKEAQKIYQINVRGNDTTNATAGATHTQFIPRRMAQANQGGDYWGSLYDPENQFNITQDPAIAEKVVSESLGVRLGEMLVDNLFLGTTPISKLYLGVDLLGGMGATPYVTSKVPQTQFRIKENSYLGIGNVATLDIDPNKPLWIDVQNWVACRTYYTTDGSTPTTASNLYHEELRFTESCTLKTLTVSVNGVAEPVKTLTVNVVAFAKTYVNPSETIQNNIPITVSFINDMDKQVFYQLGTSEVVNTYVKPFTVSQDTPYVQWHMITVHFWSEGEPKQSITYDTSNAQPSTPLVTANGVVGKIELSWTPSANATSYTVHRSTTAGQIGAILAGTQWMTKTEWTDTTVTPDVTYYYTVKATNYILGATSTQVGASAVPEVDKTPPITTLDPPAGTYNAPIYVTLTTNEPAKIWFSIDGKFPSTVYKDPIYINKDTLLRYEAEDTAGNLQLDGRANYTINTSVPEGWRYVRFQGYGDQTGITTRIVELEAVGGSTNYLLNKLPISGESPNGGNIAVATNGAKLHSSGYPFWWMGAGVPNLVYDLGQKRILDYVNYVGYSPTVDQRQTKFKIYLSNDLSNWVLLVDRSTSTTPAPTEGFAYAVDI